MSQQTSRRETEGFQRAYQLERHQVAGRNSHLELPDGVAEPEYVLKGNKVRCTRCGVKLSTRAKYIAHFRARHG